jgi:hypothetical protein
MLVNLKIRDIEPDMICSMIARINGVDLDDGNYYEQYETGIYRHDGYLFNFDSFIKNNTNNQIIVSWVDYGVCDNYEQILAKYAELFNDSNKKYVVGLSTVERKTQPSDGGWRWHKWGEYIGILNPQHEYIYDDTHIDKVYCYHIYEIL